MSFQATDIVQAIQRVSAEPGHRFGDDQVDFAALTITDHLEKSLSLFSRGTSDALIRIKSDQRPIWIGVDFFRVVFDLGLVTGELLLFVCGYPAVRRDPQVLVSNIPFCHLRVSRDHGDQFGGGGSLLYVHKAHSF